MGRTSYECSGLGRFVWLGVVGRKESGGEARGAGPAHQKVKQPQTLITSLRGGRLHMKLLSGEFY